MKLLLILLSSVLSGIQIGRIIKYYTIVPSWLQPWLAGLSTFLLCLGLCHL